MSENTEVVMTSICADELRQLRDDQQFLYALRGAGVDNWDGYDYALEIYQDLNGEDDE